MSPKEQKVRDWEDYKRSFRRGFSLLMIGAITLLGLATFVDRSGQDNSNKVILGDQTSSYVEPSFEQKSEYGPPNWKGDIDCARGILGLGLVTVGGPATLIGLARKMAKINITQKN